MSFDDSVMFNDIFFQLGLDAVGFAKEVRALGLEAEVFPCENPLMTGVTVEGKNEDMVAFRELAKDWPLKEVQIYVARLQS